MDKIELYNKLKGCMAEATFFYGPLTKKQAFDVPLKSYAVIYNKEQYAGTNEMYDGLKNFFIPVPEVPEDTTSE